MHLPLTTELIDRLAAGDLEAAVVLDGRGILPGAEETPAEFAGRLRTFNANMAKMEESLQAQGEFTVEDVTVSRGARIPAELLAEASAVTEGKFAFSNDWVPGFFIDPNCSLLFGGCAYYFYPDFFALFIIRASFQQKRRWLFYQRQELLAHELCHIARIGLVSQDFEEIFAYQTATTAFRRWLGGIFRSTTDSLLFLGGTFLQLAGQLLRTFLLPGLLIWPFWTVFLAICAFLLLRHLKDMRELQSALANLQFAFPEDNCQAVLFRCTDAEIHALSRCCTPEAMQVFLQQHQNDFRWQIIRRRFEQKAE